MGDSVPRPGPSGDEVVGEGIGRGGFGAGYGKEVLEERLGCIPAALGNLADHPVAVEADQELGEASGHGQFLKGEETGTSTRAWGVEPGYRGAGGEPGLGPEG